MGFVHGMMITCANVFNVYYPFESKYFDFYNDLFPFLYKSLPLIANYMQKGGEGVQIACKSAYVIGRPHRRSSGIMGRSSTHVLF